MSKNIIVRTKLLRHSTNKIKINICNKQTKLSETMEKSIIQRALLEIKLCLRRILKNS